MKLDGRTLSLAPVIRTVTFFEFVVLIEKLIALHGGQLSFTDGYVFGAATSVALDSGVDTFVPGGDSSYHCSDVAPDHEFNLTKYGFWSQAEHKDVQFRFVKRAALPDGINTLAGLADFLGKNPQLQLVTRHEPFEDDASLESETSLWFDVRKQWVNVFALNHFEDYEVIGARKDAANPIMVTTGKSVPMPEGQFTFRDRLEDLNHLMQLGNGGTVYFMLVEPLEAQW